MILKDFSKILQNSVQNEDFYEITFFRILTPRLWGWTRESNRLLNQV